MTTKTPIARRAVLPVCVTVACVLAATGLHAQTLASGTPIAIGLSAPLTSQFAQNGLWMRQGVELAVKEINAAGGIKGHPLQLFEEDDQGTNPIGAVNAATKLITKDHVVAIIGPHYTPSILAIEPLLAQYKVTAFTGATGPVVTQQHNDYVFRVRLNDAEGAKLLVQYLTKQQHWSKIGIDYVNTAFGQGGKAAVTAEMEAEGLKPVLMQTHLDSTKDFTPQLLSFQQAGIDGLIVWTDDQPMGLIAKQMRTLGVKFGLAGNAGLTLPDVIALGGDATDGALSVSEFIASNPDPRVQDWDKRFAAAYGTAPELYSTVYYDTTKLLADAIGRATAIDSAAIQKAMTQTHGFQGVITSYNYASGGDLVHNALITRNEKQVPTIIEKAGAAP